MKFGTIILAGVCGVVGLVAGRASAPTGPIIIAAAPPARVAPVLVVAPTPAAVTPDPEPTATEDHDDGDGSDVAAVLATLNEQAAARPTKQAVVGRLTDSQGEPAVAATVVATSPNLEGERVVLSDEHGDYQVAGLPPGFYTITIYYLDHTFVRNDIASREIEATHFDIALNEPAPHEDFVPPVIEPEQGMTIEVEMSKGITFSGSVAFENGLVDGFE